MSNFYFFICYINLFLIISFLIFSIELIPKSIFNFNIFSYKLFIIVYKKSKYGGTSRAISSLAATLHLGRVQKYTPAGRALQNSTLPHAVSTGGKL